MLGGGTGQKNGEYFYHLTAGAFSNERTARCGCIDWYIKDTIDSWSPANISCPCTRVQVENDGNFSPSVDYLFYVLNSYGTGMTLRTTDIGNWEYDSRKYNYN